MTTGGERSAGLQNGQRGKCSDAWDEHVCKWNAHDDMICNAWHASKDKATTMNNWSTPGTSVSGRHNTPPLREDLVPRSRMAPEGQRKRKRNGRTKLLLWKTSETKEPWKVKQIGRKKTTEKNKVKSALLRKREKKEPNRVALRLKRDEDLIKWESLSKKGHNTRMEMR